MTSEAIATMDLTEVMIEAETRVARDPDLVKDAGNRGQTRLIEEARIGQTTNLKTLRGEMNVVEIRTLRIDTLTLADTAMSVTMRANGKDTQSLALDLNHQDNPKTLVRRVGMIEVTETRTSPSHLKSLLLKKTHKRINKALTKGSTKGLLRTRKILTKGHTKRLTKDSQSDPQKDSQKDPQEN